MAGLLVVLLVLLMPATASASHLPAPEAGAVTNVTTSSARHDWGAVWGREYYFAYLYDDQGRQLRRVQTPHSDRTWTGLASCTTYRSSASAFAGGHESARSTPVSFKTGGTCPAPTPSPTPTVTPTPTPTPGPGSTLAWSDEFNGPAGAAPDPANWSLRTGGRWMNGGTPELQCYTTRPENASQDGAGNLRIVARYEPGYAGCADGTNDYTSARLDSKLKREFRYGRVEARIKPASARGTWPAWWAIGATGTWPGAGEIDMLEYRPGVAPSAAHHALHGATTGGSHWQRSFDTSALSSWSSAYHVFGVVWSPGKIEVQVDGVTQRTFTPGTVPSDAVWPFDKPFYLLLNVAVGNWGCAGAASPCPDPAQFPATTLVDWVRVYSDEAAPPPPPPPPPSSSDPVIAGAGDIAASNGGSEATAKLLDGMPDLAAVFTTGDNAYPDGTDANYATYYHPTWGRHKAKTRPVPGNHEYHVADAPGYFNYFSAAAGPRGKGWYSYDVGAWHLIALNSSRAGSTCSPVPCGPGSEQYEWLKADLAMHPNRCVLAYWHHPLFTRGNYSPGIAGVKPLWDLLYANGADVVLNGHDHNYQRFAPLNPSGQLDTLRGIREFVIGEGGNTEYTVQSPGGNLEASQSGTRGVLRLALHPTSYDWEFVPVAGKTYRDAGAGTCH